MFPAPCRRLPALLLCSLILATQPAGAQQTAAPADAGAMPAALQPPPKFLARDLLAGCEAADGTARQTGCLRYLLGAAAMYELAVGAGGKELGWFCTPRDAPAALLRQQYVAWAKDNADQMTLEAIQAVRLALADAFPCQE
ncbi:Rap1a/Tai family immunity protein [Ferrovibrio sp.]|uniref:Rap1a/Tai family immunity protein n=1 Tax=Ferrovibrio sp. TaxID=1917215 RepID=UPI00311F3E4E